MEPLRVRGLVAAVLTPMDQAGELSLGVIPEIVTHLERTEVAGVYIAGSTGEGMSLTDEERQAVTEAYLTSCRGRLRTFVQVGHNSAKASAILAAHAAEHGADAISATPPGYFQASGEEGLIESLRPVADAAPGAPFYYYHIPQLSGVRIDVVRFTALAVERLPTFRGIKYSDPAGLHNLPLLQEVGPGLEFLSGSDEAYLQCLAQGYEGAVGSTFNYAAPLYHRVREAFEAGDLVSARQWQGRALAMIAALFETCGRDGLKVMMEMIGLPCGPSRRPIEPSTAEQVEELRNRLEEMGWFQWVSNARTE